MWAFFLIIFNRYMDSIGIIMGLVGLVIGFAVAKFMERGKGSKIISNSKKEGANIVKEAKLEGENIKKDKIYQAKEKFLELKAEHEKVIINKEKKILEAEKRTRDKESQISSDLAKGKKLSEQLEEKLKEVDYKSEFFDKKQSELEKLHKSQVQQLEVIRSEERRVGKESRWR